MPLTTEIAQRMIVASQEKAREIGIAVSTAILDAEGRLYAFARMDGAHWMSIESSQAKAFTGVMFRRDGPDLAQVPAEVLTTLSTLQGRGLMAMGSVTTVREDDKVIAGVGCAGGADDQDGQCAHAARDAYTS
jgi:glc operon protein GlcG